jgi:hypothetical protein
VKKNPRGLLERLKRHYQTNTMSGSYLYPGLKI